MDLGRKAAFRVAKTLTRSPSLAPAERWCGWMIVLSIIADWDYRLCFRSRLRSATPTRRTASNAGTNGKPMTTLALLVQVALGHIRPHDPESPNQTKQIPQPLPLRAPRSITNGSRQFPQKLP